MELDALLLHATARRSVRLGRADPHTLVDVLSGAFGNVKQRWDPDETLEETEGETSGTAWLATSIVVDRDEDVVDLRLRSSISKAAGTMDIQVRSAGDHLAYMIACIPSNAVRELHVQGVEPLRVLWRYMKHSTSLLDLHIIGRSAEGFANTIEQDPKMFANLRRVFIGGRICQPGLVATLSSLLRALASRHADGMTQLETLAIPEGTSRQSLTLFELRSKTGFPEMPDPLNLSDESLPKLAALLLDDPTLWAPVAQLMANRIEDALTLYFSQPSRFRRALGDARAVLSGSWVLLFTEAHSSTTPPAWTEGDLDVFCPEDGLAIMVASLLEEGYTPANAAQNWDPPSMKSKTGSISRVLKFHHALRERKVDIVCSLAISPVEVVLSFWTTLVMNVVTVHDLTVLYPGLTLSHEGCLPVDHSETNEIGHLADKYIARGYQFHPFPGQHPTDHLPDKPRNTRDEHCLNLPIATPDGYTRAPMGTSVTEWRMDRFARGEDCTPYVVTTRTRGPGGSSCIGIGP
ncbi:hypothetical protein K488DRAFT_83723 [Vararia minispora EC-137]|uniref:Uncharacterized protein n=1 Tax=Vararia minispora EC-137 TaxID=1314806 RepID=A0ACB8QTT2_9AGAM|nr:hypothetical protein K488DRAFT_83723 [Vararia minispora EC-137]